MNFIDIKCRVQR